MPTAQPTRKQLQDLAKLRLKEAEALFAAGLYDGSVYLAGYVVELALKARICRILGLNEYPLDIGNAYKIHALETLKVLAGLSTEINVAKNKDLFDNWSRAVTWNPEGRYKAPGTNNQASAKLILDSIKAKPNGVLTWLSKRW